MGLAERLLQETGSLLPYNSYMLLSTSKKTYPDEVVLSFAQWASQHSNMLAIIVAEGQQVYNKMATREFNRSALTEAQEKKLKEEIREYRKLAEKRAFEVGRLITGQGLTNAKVVLWNDLLFTLPPLELRDSTRKMFQTKGIDPIFDEKVAKLTRERAAELLVRSKGDPKTSEYIAGLYTREEVFMMIALADLSYSKYKLAIKIGPESERAYDEIAKDIMEYGFGTARMTYDKNELSNFGAVHLQLEDPPV